MTRIHAMTDDEWARYEDDHLPEIHFQVWNVGCKCNCVWWYSDVEAFEKIWRDSSADYTKLTVAEMAAAAENRRNNFDDDPNLPVPVSQPVYDVILVPDSDAYVMFRDGCPICEYPEAHSHTRFYVEDLIGKDTLEQMLANSKTNEEGKSVFRIRAIDRSRKLAIVRTVRGKRKEAIRYVMDEAHTLMTHTSVRPPATVDLARCEPLVRLVK